MRKNITRAAIAGAAATAMLIGAAGAATAQPALPGPVGDAADAISRAAADALPGAQRTQIGEHLTQLWVYDAKMYKEIRGSQTVTAGEKITVRIEVEGNAGQTRVHALTDVMPAGFAIDSVVYNAPDGTATTLEAGQYHTETRGDVQDTRVDFASNGIDRVHVGVGTMSVDFTYIAPEQTGWYDNSGGGMEISGAAGAFHRGTKVDEGGPSINVIARPVIDIPGLPGGDNNSSGSIDWGSLNIGDTGSAN